MDNPSTSDTMTKFVLIFILCTLIGFAIGNAILGALK